MFTKMPVGKMPFGRIFQHDFNNLRRPKMKTWYLSHPFTTRPTIKEAPPNQAQSMNIHDK